MGRRRYYIIFFLASTIVWLLSGIWPIVQLIREFGENGKYYALVYSHFFLFPLVVVPFILVSIAEPLVFTINLSKKRRWLKLLFLLVPILFSAVGTLTDVTWGDRAIWEISSSSHIPLKCLLCEKDNASLSDTFRALIEKGPSVGAAGLKNFEADRKTFSDFLNRAGGREDSALLRSTTWYLYVLSHFVLVAIFLAVFLLICVFLIPDFSRTAGHDRAVRWLPFAFFFCSLWIPLRLLFLSVKQYLYPVVTYVGEVPIALLAFFGYLYLVGICWRNYGQVAIIIGGLIVTIVSATLPKLRPDLHNLFLATPIVYLLIFMACFLVILPVILTSLEKRLP